MTRAPWLGRSLIRTGVLVSVATCILVIDVGCNQRILRCEPRCEGNTKVTCAAGGYEGSAREDCGSRTCVEDFRTYESYAACAIGSRDPQCNPEIDDVVCNGDQIKFCRGAFVESVTDCKPGGLTCAVRVSGNGHDGECVTSSVPDRRCASQASDPHLFCDADFVASCFDQFVKRASASCSVTGKHCGVHGTLASCE
ncbi:MAG: hypothetical protein QOI41_3777 [Myxococcales bacterium]|nr:hypothetical protein [Myxococcales bacterium]